MILSSIVIAPISEKEDSETASAEQSNIIEYEDPTSADGIYSEATPATQTQPAVPATYIPDTTAQYQINNIPPEVKINSVDGSIFNMEITNALFSLGSLIQGSFISISNNNNVYLKSLFDNSQFTATMNKDGHLL